MTRLIAAEFRKLLTIRWVICASDRLTG